MADWKEVAIDCESHLKRAIDMYEELGFAVRLEEVQPGEVDRCTECLQATGEKLYRVYAKRSGDVQGQI